MVNRIGLGIALASFLFLAQAHRAKAQTSPGELVLAAGPMQTGAGDQAQVCATNLGAAPVAVTIELLDAMTGAVVAQQDGTLGTAGSPGAPGTGSSPGSGAGLCISSDKPSVAIIGVLIGHVVAVNPQPLPPHTVTLAGSLQVFSLGTSGEVMNPRYAALTRVHPPEPCSVGR